MLHARDVLPRRLGLATLIVLVAALAIAACSADSDGPAEDAPPTPTTPTLDATASDATASDARPPASFLPPDLTWQWQLQGDLNTNYDVGLFDIDLFDTSAAQIAALHDDGRTVLCYFSAGSGENWRPDYGRIPAAALGAPLDGWEGERWLDIRVPGGRPGRTTDAGLRAVLLARLDLAVERGCDGVEPDNVDAWQNDTGFPIRQDDQIEFNRWLAAGAHERGLFIALKNAGSIAPQLAGVFDLALNEQCHAFDECEDFRPFLDTGKPVLNVEYTADAPSAQALAREVCPRAKVLGLRTLILPLDLDDAFRVACD